MAQYKVTGGSQAVEKPFGWHVWHVEFTELATSEDPAVVLDTFPLGTIVLDAKAIVVVADTAATSSSGIVTVGNEGVLSITDVKAAATVTTGVAAEIVDATQDGISVEQDVLLTLTRTGAATTLPTVVIAILCGRVTY